MTTTGEATAIAMRDSIGREQVELLKRTICQGATDDELALFVQAAKRLQLDPFARQVFAVKRWDGQQRREVMAIQVSIDGFRLVAERTGKYAGQLGPFWSADGKEWLEVWLGKEPPAAAKVAVLRHDFKEPVWAVATWEQYKQTKKEGGVTAMWAKMGPLMLAKCAESLALRRAFPNELSGVYTQEEMQQAAPPAVEYEAPKEKKTTAADIPWEGGPITDDQLAAIAVLRQDCGGEYTGTGNTPAWLKIIRVYRRPLNGDLVRCADVAELAKLQGTHLIERMKGYLVRVTKRANQPVDISPIDPRQAIEKAVRECNIEPQTVVDYVLACFGADSITELTDKQEGMDALSFVLAIAQDGGTPGATYQAAVEKWEKRGAVEA